MIRIHIDRLAMRRGNPCIVVERDGAVAKSKRVDVIGPSSLVFSERGMPGRPSINVWVETDSPVVMDGNEF